MLNKVFLIIFFIVGCTFINKESKSNSPGMSPNIKVKNIAYIKIDMFDSVQIIRDTGRISNLISKINSSTIEYIKFGSHDNISIYDKNGVVLILPYRGDLFKYKGWAYRCEENLID